MRDYLQDIEIVGPTMVYQERDLCRWSLDWLFANCDRVCILLDNWDAETEAIVIEYKNKYPDRTHVAYSEEPVDKNKDKITGQTKRRFKLRQNYIRENVIKELRKMHEEKPIDLLIWPDSDETFINEFPKYLTAFWGCKEVDFMSLGFLASYNSFKAIMFQKMAPHGRVYRYNPEMTAHPYRSRTVYHPYEKKRPWRVRNVVLHMCLFDEVSRKRREFFDHVDFSILNNYSLWILPKDVREMTVEEIADYQLGAHGVPSKFPPITVAEYNNNRDKYNN